MRRSWLLGTLAAFGLSISLTGCSRVQLQDVSFSQSANTLETYDFVEVVARIAGPRVKNPFLDATLRGRFDSADGRQWDIEGFCDSPDGTTFRIRFMPPTAGNYRYSVEYRQGNGSVSSTGTFQAYDTHRRGPLRRDPEYPWHFIWEGTREHYFLNGTTAYWLMGWSDENIIRSSVERLHRLKVNRIRVTVAGRTNQFYGEPVMVGPSWTTYITPWPAKMPEDIYHPGFDYARFYVPYWQKFDRMLQCARDHDVIISLVLDMDNSYVHPEADSEDERRFFRYAIARFSAFSNITWDLGDDIDSYRSSNWTHETGEFIEQQDPYHHLATSHPARIVDQDLTANWFGFTSYQEWSRDQHAFMLGRRKRQEAAGRIIPQTNEEYGYEDHYPKWAQGPGSESADTLRRAAWDIVMAGGYQTTGESARRGTNIWPDSGGGWMNGRGDDTMTMLEGYAQMVDFFTSFEWWKTEPHDELVNRGNYCLAKSGEVYAIYLPHGGKATTRLGPGWYDASWFNPLSGERIALGTVSGPSWISPTAPANQDWAILLQRSMQHVYSH